MCSPFLYNVEFNVDDFDLWTYPCGLDNPEELPTIVRFTTAPSISLEIGDEEFVDQVNCDKKIVKNAMYSLTESELKTEMFGQIEVFKAKCPGNEVSVGVYELDRLECKFQHLAKEYKKNSGPSEGCGVVDKCRNQPGFEIIKELVQLSNAQTFPCGSLYYTLRITCFGPTIVNAEKSASCNQSKAVAAEECCLDRGAPPASCKEKPDYDEYAAEVNGNQLIIRVHKDDRSNLVTQVHDANMDQNGNEIPGNGNVVSICGCKQQIDFKFMDQNSSGDDCKPKCDEQLTDHQKKTSCVGKSFQNSNGLPAIRGNLKYPGRLNGSIKFDVIGKCPTNVAEKYRAKPIDTRGVCAQVDEENVDQELKCKCRVPKGIEVCKKGCEPESDVFILKIGSKRTNKPGQANAIELEMRTPRGPDNEKKKMETREIQVNEDELNNEKKVTEKKKVSTPTKEATKKKVVAPTKEIPKKKGVAPSKEPAKKPAAARPTKGFVTKK